MKAIKSFLFKMIGFIIFNQSPVHQACSNLNYYHIMMNLILIFDLVYNCKFFWSEKKGLCRPIRQPLSQWLFTSLTYLICLVDFTDITYKTYRHTSISTILSPILDIPRVCSHEADFRKQTTEMKSWFLKRGYPNNVIEKEMKN